MRRLYVAGYMISFIVVLYGGSYVMLSRDMAWYTAPTFISTLLILWSIVVDFSCRLKS